MTLALFIFVSTLFCLPSELCSFAKQTTTRFQPTACPYILSVKRLHIKSAECLRKGENYSHCLLLDDDDPPRILEHHHKIFCLQRRLLIASSYSAGCLVEILGRKLYTGIRDRIVTFLASFHSKCDFCSSAERFRIACIVDTCIPLCSR